MLKCLHCGAWGDARAAVCMGCGKPAELAYALDAYCLHCGAALAPEDRFCCACGARRGGGRTAAVPPAMPGQS
ncbi:double zinc ribbon domain-containing protein [Rhodocyclus purpureus]|uniref:double zinc ribbon domain-containing protein n=1 Tax=Rhodocyclus purpureus TaxID=1067 RepID=UPI0019135896|nr:zinc ribbon domain-containing protein [Rhodocyclus purpureus]